MIAHTIADIVGDGAAHVIGAALTRARWIIFSATGGTARAGDVNTAANRGVILPAGIPVKFPADPDITAAYDLGSIYVYVPLSTTVTITYGD